MKKHKAGKISQQCFLCVSAVSTYPNWIFVWWHDKCISSKVNDSAATTAHEPMQCNVFSDDKNKSRCLSILWYIEYISVCKSTSQKEHWVEGPIIVLPAAEESAHPTTSFHFFPNLVPNFSWELIGHTGTHISFSVIIYPQGLSSSSAAERTIYSLASGCLSAKKSLFLPPHLFESLSIIICPRIAGFCASK